MHTPHWIWLWTALLTATAWPQTDLKPPVFIFRIAETPATLDWNSGEPSWPVLLPMMEGLTRIGQDGGLKLQSAQSMQWLGRNRDRIRFKLRSKARWSDGLPLCAQHFIDAWERARSPGGASPYGELLEPVLSAKANGCAELTVQLRRPTPDFPQRVGHWVFFPIRKDLIQKWGEKSAFTLPHLVGTGAYRLTQVRPDRDFSFVPSEHYWDQRSAERPQVQVRVIQDDTTALRLFELGEADWLKDLPWIEKKHLRRRPEFHELESLVSYHLGFSAEMPKKIRCALSRSLDRAQIPDFLGGGEIPANSVVPQVLTQFWEASVAHKIKTASPLPIYDVQRARVLWQSEKHIPTEMTLHFYNKDVHIPLMEWVQGQWKKNLGLTVRLQKHDSKSYWAFLGSPNRPSLFLSGITAAYAHPQAFLKEFSAKNPANFGRIHLPRFEKYLISGEDSAAEKDLLEECAIAPLYFRTTAWMVRSRWQGWEVNPMGYVDLTNLRKKDTGVTKY